MEALLEIHETYPWLIFILIVLILWEGIWKLMALWRAGRNNHFIWFICIALINTMGILPIIYILTDNKKRKRSDHFKK